MTTTEKRTLLTAYDQHDVFRLGYIQKYGPIFNFDSQKVLDDFMSEIRTSENILKLVRTLINLKLFPTTNQDKCKMALVVPDNSLYKPMISEIADDLELSFAVTGLIDESYVFDSSSLPKDIILFMDTVTSGRSTIEFIERFRRAGHRANTVVSIFDNMVPKKTQLFKDNDVSHFSLLNKRDYVFHHLGTESVFEK